QLLVKATRLAPETDVSSQAISDMKTLECLEPVTGGGTPTPEEDPTLEYISYGLMGAGLLALTGGAILLVSNDSDVQTLNDLENATDNQAFVDEGFNNASEFNDFKSDVESRQTWTTVLTASGIALIGAGAAVYFWPTGSGDTQTSSETSSLRWTPWIDPVQGTVGGAIGWELD
ncbi:MAG: hypothetical protein AAFX99_28660, partial [Myxococcota bacterium]